MFKLFATAIKLFVAALVLPFKLLAAAWRLARWTRFMVKFGAIFVAVGAGIAWGLKQATGRALSRRTAPHPIPSRRAR